jgi:HlyD family secretion protein
MKRKTLYWIIGVVVVLLIAGGVYMRVRASRQAANTADVQTATVALGNVSVTISGVGTIRSQQDANINWQTSGTVKSVSTSIGQQVQSGEVLAALDLDTLPSSVLQAQLDLIDAQNALDDLKKPQPLKIAQAQTALDNAKTALENLLHPADAAIAQAQLAVINAQDAADTAQRAVDKLQYGRASAEALATAQAAYVVAQADVAQKQAAYDEVGGDPSVDPRKAQALSVLEASKAKEQRALATLNWYTGERTQAEIDSTHTDLAVAQGNLADAQEALDKLQHPTAEDIALAQATVDDAQETLNSLENGPSQDDLLVAETRVTLAKAAVAQATLTAPFAGTITDIQVIPGDIVSAGTTAFRIDDLSKLYIDLQVSEVDIPQVKVGQDTTITFDAIVNKEYHGKVTQVGMVGSVSQGVVNYPVIVQLTDGDASILPSMTASVNIVVAESKNVMVVPNKALKLSNGQRTVTVLFEGQQISVPVTVGLTGTSTSEVTSDQLRQGDTVVLSSTSTTTSTNNARGGFGGGGNFEVNGPVFIGP